MNFTSDEQVRVQLQAFRGQQGPIGKTPQLSIGRVETLAAGEAAYASLSGTAEEPVLSMGLPGGKAGKTAVHNLLHNADFTQMVAQAGIAQRHTLGGAILFAADRWELVSGSMSAQENAEKNGYSGVTLNGTIRQKVENTPTEGVAGVTVLSGAAQAAYADGVFTITSDGGVLDQAYLCTTEEGAGVAEVKPMRRGYAAELLDCQRYYLRLPAAGEMSYVGYVLNSSTVRVTLPLPVPMRLEYPTVSFTYRANVVLYPGGITPTEIVSAHAVGTACGIVFAAAGMTGGECVVMKPNATIELSADP